MPSVPRRLIILELSPARDRHARSCNRLCILSKRSAQTARTLRTDAFRRLLAREPAAVLTPTEPQHLCHTTVDRLPPYPTCSPAHPPTSPPRRHWPFCDPDDARQTLPRAWSLLRRLECTRCIPSRSCRMEALETASWTRTAPLTRRPSTQQVRPSSRAVACARRRKSHSLAHAACDSPLSDSLAPSLHPPPPSV